VTTRAGVRAAEIALLLVVLFWAANYSLIQYILRSVPLTVFVTLRFLIIAVAGWAVVAARRRPAGWALRDVPLLAAIGVIGGGIYQYLFILGLSMTTSFSSALLNSTAPLLSLGMLAALRLEKIEARHWAGYAVAFGGVALFLLEGGRAGRNRLEGDLVSLAAAFCWAVYGILAKNVSHRYPASVVGAWTYTACFVSIAVYGAAPTLGYPVAAIAPVVWTAIVLSGVVAVTIGWIVWVHGIRVLGVAGTVKFSFLVPISAGLFAAVFQGERFTFVKILGALGVLAGLFLARVPGWRTPPVESEEPAAGIIPGSTGTPSPNRESSAGGSPPRPGERQGPA
jgi:drug/metabolite transporter (DMT)-like permease